MSGTLALSSLIASLDREGLAALVRARRIASPGAVKDPLDLAAELLRADSIAQALCGTGREELAALAAIGGLVVDQPADPAPETIARLSARGLVIGGNEAVLFATELPEVTRALESLLAARGVSIGSLLAARESGGPDAHGDEPAATPDTSAWYAPALTAIAQAAWLLRDLARAPAHLNRNGVVASAWVKSVAERLSIPHADEFVEPLRRAGLVEPGGSELIATGDAWLEAEREDRWIALALAAVSLMPARALELLLETPGPSSSDGARISLEGLGSRLSARFPLVTEATLQATARAASLWERLGITVDGVLSSAGLAAVLGSDHPGRLGLPDSVPGVYIQPDLSVVVPGPLSASDEAGLAAVTIPEQLGVASTLRITEATLAEALERGVRADELREFLEHLTLTGIPQPLDYLISALGERARSIVVSPCHGDADRSRVDFVRPELRSRILVDRGLAHLQLHEPEGDSFTSGTAAPLFSRLRADHVLAALLDARYPAIGAQAPGVPGAPDTSSRSAEQPSETHGTDLHGTDPHGTDLHGADARSTDPHPASDPLDALVDRVLAAASDGPSDIGRQVTLAIRDRSPIRVTVEMRGEARDFTIVPVSLAAGRMRALDEAAGVERTLPLDAITAVAQLG